MSKTALLPTGTAVRMVWAMTGKFSNDDSSKDMARYIEETLNSIEGKASKLGPTEESYITSAIATMKACLRSVETAYKGRELNFKENEKLRTAYLESVKESLDFGNKINDLLKSLPTMTIATLGGVTLAEWFGMSGINLWGLGIFLAAAGYLVNLWFVRNARNRTQILYVSQDYERDLYYEQYLNRVKESFKGLYSDLERIHLRVFNENYEVKSDPAQIKDYVDSILAGVCPTFCKHIHTHMYEQKITPKLWAWCECGDAETTKKCPLWPK